MDVSTFFTRLLHSSKQPVQPSAPDDIVRFDKAWHTIQVSKTPLKYDWANVSYRRPSSIRMNASSFGMSPWFFNWAT